MGEWDTGQEEVLYCSFYSRNNLAFKALMASIRDLATQPQPCSAVEATSMSRVALLVTCLLILGIVWGLPKYENIFFVKAKQKGNLKEKNGSIKPLLSQHNFFFKVLTSPGRLSTLA